MGSERQSEDDCYSKSRPCFSLEDSAWEVTRGGLTRLWQSSGLSGCDDMGACSIMSCVYVLCTFLYMSHDAQCLKGFFFFFKERRLDCSLEKIHRGRGGGVLGRLDHITYSK